jgi:anti-anti-sigma factor
VTESLRSIRIPDSAGNAFAPPRQGHITQSSQFPEIHCVSPARRILVQPNRNIEIRPIAHKSPSWGSVRHRRVSDRAHYPNFFEPTTPLGAGKRGQIIGHYLQSRPPETTPIEKGRPDLASTPDFQHLNLSRVKDTVLVEIVSKDLAARALGAELSLVTAQEWARRLLIDFRRISYLSSTGFAVLFKLVSQFTSSGGQIKLCNMDPGVRLGAEIVGLDKVVQIFDNEAAALAAFQAS